MKVFFDSNVWRLIVTPSIFKNEKSIGSFKIIRQAIVDKKIQPFISKTTFTLEAIKKTDRKNILGNKKLKIITNVSSQDGNKITTGFTIGGNKIIDFSNNPILKRHYEDAYTLGFKVVGLARIGMLNNDDIENMTYKFEDHDFHLYMEKAGEIVRRIEEAGAGKSHLDKIGQKYHHLTFEGIKIAPESEKMNIDKATAEWADGDSVASSIALGCDYFCTRDVAKGAGNLSVFSMQNLRWLSEDYNFNSIAPEDLALKFL